MKVQGYSRVRVKKLVAGFERSMKPDADGFKKVATGYQGSGRPLCGHFVAKHPVTEATSQAEIHTSFPAQIAKLGEGAPRDREDDVGLSNGDADRNVDEDDSMLWGFLAGLIPVMILLTIVYSNWSITNTLNVLPITINLPSPGPFVIGTVLFTAWQFWRCLCQPSVVDVGTQTEWCSRSVQETLYPTQCTDPGKGHKAQGSLNSDKDILSQVILAIHKSTEV